MTLPVASDGSRARFNLVLAIALLLHVLALVMAPESLHTPSEKTVSVQLTLMATSTQASQASDKPAAKPLFPDVEPVSVPPSAPPMVATHTEAPPPATSPPAPKPRAEETLPEIIQTTPAVATSTPSDSEKLRQETTTMQPVISPYELEIRRYIAREVRYESLLAELETPRRLVLELQLMGNGVLERARIALSSGDERLDHLARQAALMASPFPAVPQDQPSRRFQVELRFNPAAASHGSASTAATDKG